MRVVLLTHRLPYAPNRGDRIRAYHLLRMLARQHEVHVLSLVHDAEEATHAEALRSVAASVVAVPVSRASRLPFAAFALPTKRPLTHVLLHSPAVAAELRGVVARARPEVTLAYCSAMARYAMEPPLDRIPWILDMVDVDSEKWATLGQGRGPTAAIYRREGRVLREFERRAIRVASATTVVSERERVLLSSVAPDVPCQVVPNGIDVSAFSCAAPPSASRSVIFCGVFNYGPNEAGAVWLATAVWPLVQREIPEARLWLVGMHPTPAVQRLAADGSITVTGAVEAVQPFLWASAVAAAPLLMARGVQNKVLEALAAGLPCVVTPQVMEGLPEVVRAGCVMAVDAPAFAQALVTLLRLPPSERRAIAGRAELDALSWEAQLAPILDLLAAAAGRSGEHAHA